MVVFLDALIFRLKTWAAAFGMISEAAAAAISWHQQSQFVSDFQEMPSCPVHLQGAQIAAPPTSSSR